MSLDGGGANTTLEDGRQKSSSDSVSRQDDEKSAPPASTCDMVNGLQLTFKCEKDDETKTIVSLSKNVGKSNFGGVPVPQNLGEVDIKSKDFSELFLRMNADRVNGYLANVRIDEVIANKKIDAFFKSIFGVKWQSMWCCRQTWNNPNSTGWTAATGTVYNQEYVKKMFEKMKKFLSDFKENTQSLTVIEWTRPDSTNVFGGKTRNRKRRRSRTMRKRQTL